MWCRGGLFSSLFCFVKIELVDTPLSLYGTGQKLVWLARGNSERHGHRSWALAAPAFLPQCVQQGLQCSRLQHLASDDAIQMYQSVHIQKPSFLVIQMNMRGSTQQKRSQSILLLILASIRSTNLCFAAVDEWYELKPKPLLLSKMFTSTQMQQYNKLWMRQDVKSKGVTHRLIVHNT